MDLLLKDFCQEPKEYLHYLLLDTVPQICILCNTFWKM